MKIDKLNTEKSDSIRLDKNIAPFIVILVLLQLTFLNGIYLFLGFFLFFLLFFLLQKPYRPAIFTLFFSYHIIQVISGVWLSNYLGKDINYRSDLLGQATFFSYLGISVMFIPIYYVQKRLPFLEKNDVVVLANQLSTKRVFEWYLIMFFSLIY